MLLQTKKGVNILAISIRVAFKQSDYPKGNVMKTAAEWEKQMILYP